MKFAALLLALACAVPVSAGQSDSDRLPAELPEIGEGWHIEVSGPGAQVASVLLANAEGEWALYSSPRSPYLYVVSHYRFSPKKETGLFAPAGGKQYREREVVAWFDESDSNRQRFFEKIDRNEWREIDRISPEWLRERGIVLRLWSVHALIGAYGADPATLTF